MGEFVEDLIDNNDLEQDFLDALDDDLLLRELIMREMEVEIAVEEKSSEA